MRSLRAVATELIRDDWYKSDVASTFTESSFLIAFSTVLSELSFSGSSTCGRFGDCVWYFSSHGYFCNGVCFTVSANF